MVCIASSCSRLTSNESAVNNVIGSSTSTGESKTLAPSPTITSDNRQGFPVASNNAGAKESEIQEKVMGSDKKQLNEEDFEITYKSIRINQNTKVEDITKKLGFPEDYEENNQGFISGNAKYRRWNLWYPIYSKQEIRMIVLSELKYIGEEVKDGKSYIVGIDLGSFGTNKSLKVGDEVDRVLQLYGRPDSFEKNNEYAEGLYFLRYTKNGLNLDITLDNDMKTVKSIFIDFKLKKSIEEQQGADN